MEEPGMKRNKEDKMGNNELEKLEKKVQNLKQARENLMNGNITKEDITIILETLRQAEFNLARDVSVIKIGLQDDNDYRETYRNKK